jgi:peptidoglycan hydrolase-like protein with peptidoglycan-binding domain
MVTEGHMEWRRILCETNVNNRLVARIQRALRRAGHDPVYIDGMLGRRTKTAIRAYQREKGLAVGGLTYETIESLSHGVFSLHPRKNDSRESTL